MSVEQYRELEQRVDQLEKKVAVQAAKENYFQNILAGQRWTFGTAVSLFAVLAGLVGFGTFRHYMNRIEETDKEMREHVKRKTEGMASVIERQEKLISSLVRRVDKVERNKKDESMGHVGLDYVGVFMDSLDRAEKLAEGYPDDTNKQHLSVTLDNLRGSLDSLIDSHGEVPASVVERAPAVLRELRNKVEGEDLKVIRDLIEKVESVD